MHRYFFSHDSNRFDTRLSHITAQEPSSSPVISLENVKSKDFDVFLSVLYPLCVLYARIGSRYSIKPFFFLAFRDFNESEGRCLKPPTPSNDSSWDENTPSKSG